MDDGYGLWIMDFRLFWPFLTGFECFLLLLLFIVFDRIWPFLIVEIFLTAFDRFWQFLAIFMRYFFETFWRDILTRHIDGLWKTLMTCNDLWYGNNFKGMALWQFWLCLVCNTCSCKSVGSFTDLSRHPWTKSLTNMKDLTKLTGKMWSEIWPWIT